LRVEAVVTGLGAVGPHGIGEPALRAALAAGRPLAREVDGSGGLHERAGARHAALVPDVDLTPWLPAAQARRLGRPSRWAVAAARMALSDASLPGLEGRRTAIVLSTAFGAVLYTEKLVRQILEEGPEAAQPFYFSECVANAAAGQAAIALGARGANVTVTQREAGPLLALLRGAAEIVEGRADVVLVGSADEMTPLLHALLDRFGAVGRAAPGRPFDLHRDGMLAGEGAVVLVLERAVDAGARGARPVARVAGGGAAFDPTATASDWGTGVAGLGRALRETLRRSECAPDQIDVVVSGASGSRRGDRLEGLVLRALYPGGVPPVLAPKAVVGEYAGGVLSAGLLAMRGAAFGPLAAFETPDPDLAIAPHGGQPLPPVRRALLSSLAAGGAAAWAVLETV
jgi:3-oxoacyl-[acyl-carrier-protein] synthase II